MRKFAAIAATILSLCVSVCPSQTMNDTVLTMSDGIFIDALYAIPSAPPPAGGFPAIVIVHGFGGSKENSRASARTFAQQGYVATAYSVRGQGSSGGEFDFFTSERIIDDLRSVIHFTKALSGVNGERLAVVGGSQGGIHAWAAAAYDLGVRTVVSVIANGRFEEDWIENDAINWTFARTIAVTSVHVKPGLRDSVNVAVSTGKLNYLKQMLSGYSTAPLEDHVTVPVAILASYHDGFFNQNATLRQFAALRSPKKIILYPAGHALPADQQQLAYVDWVENRWLDYWLKDRTEYAAICSPDSAVVMFDTDTGAAYRFSVADSAFWKRTTGLSSGIRPITWYFSQSGLTATPPPTAGQNTTTYINYAGSTPIVFRTPPFPSDVMIAGTPGHATLYADGTGSLYQMNLCLYDYDPATAVSNPLTRGHSQVAQNVSGRTDTLDFDLCSVLCTVKSGHILEARVHGGIPLFPNPQNDFGNYVVGPSTNSLNTMYFGGQTPSSLTVYAFDPTTAINHNPRLPTPELLVLLPPSPNPLSVSGMQSSTARISFASATGRAQLDVYDELGRIVARLYSGHVASGMHTVAFMPGTLPSGMYSIVLTDGIGYRSKRIDIVR